jgi:hypothetical protein
MNVLEHSHTHSRPAHKGFGLLLQRRKQQEEIKHMSAEINHHKVTRPNDKTYTFTVEVPPFVKKSLCWNLTKGDWNPSQVEEGVEKGAIKIGFIPTEAPWASTGWSPTNRTK